MTENQSKLETTKQLKPLAIRPLSKERISRQVEGIFEKDSAVVEEKFNITIFSPEERAEKLYSYLTDCRDWQKKFKKNQTIEPFNSRLLAVMQTLWQDEATKNIFLDRYEQANFDYVLSIKSLLNQEIISGEQKIKELKGKYQQLISCLFLGRKPEDKDKKLSPSDEQMLEFDLAAIIDNEDKQAEKLKKLKECEPAPENTDIIAFSEYKELLEMQKQLSSDSFVWTESMTELFEEALISITNGRWPLFIGEAGTSKTVLAGQIAKVLTGERPTLVACTSYTSEGHLIARMAMAGEQTYEEYAAAMQALSGFKDSKATSPQVSPIGRICRLDEFFKLGKDSPVFAFLKELAQLKEDDVYHNRKVLKGFKIFATTNPSGARYDNPEVNPALMREFAPILTDYFAMSHNKPELYKFMIASLMNEQGIFIGVSKDELAPAYEEQEAEGKLSDGRIITGKWQLIEDVTNIKHGFLYRLAFAIRAVQDAFCYGNGAPLKANALSKGGEAITLTSSTFTPNDIKSWLKTFPNRYIYHHFIGKTKTLTEYLQEQLKLYIKQSSGEDRENLKFIFEHFHLLDSPAKTLDTTSLTPKDIGYLSPLAPRPVLYKLYKEPEPDKPLPPPEIDKELNIYEERQVVLENTDSINMKVSDFMLENGNFDLATDKLVSRVVIPGTKIDIEGRDFLFVGVVEDKDSSQNGQPIIQPASGEALYRVISPKDLDLGIFSYEGKKSIEDIDDMEPNVKSLF